MTFGPMGPPGGRRPPGGARAGVQGVFHPTYRGRQADAAHLMGWRALSVIKGGGGEFERHPGKAVSASGLREGTAWEEVWPALSSDVRRLSDGPSEPAALNGLWDGTMANAFAEDIVCGTAELALSTVGSQAPGAHVRALWSGRRRSLAA